MCYGCEWLARRAHLSCLSYVYVSSTMERNVFWVRVSCTTGASLASYDHVSSTIERNVLWVRIAGTTGASLASYDHVSSTIERNVLWVRMSRTTGGSPDRPSHTCAHASGASHSRIEGAGLVADVSMQDSQSKGGRKGLILASYDHVSSTMESFSSPDVQPNGANELRIEFEDYSGNRAYAKYSSFNVEDSSSKYRLSVSTAGDAIAASYNDNKAGWTLTTLNNVYRSSSGPYALVIF